MVQQLSAYRVAKEVNHLLEWHKYNWHDFEEHNGSFGAFIYNESVTFYVSNPKNKTPEIVFKKGYALDTDLSEYFLQYLNKDITKTQLLSLVESKINNMVTFYNGER